MSRAERREKAAEYFGKSGGHVTLSECQTCGYLDWVSTATKEPNGFSVSPSYGSCPRCAIAFQRAPELVEWVLGAIEQKLEGKL